MQCATCGGGLEQGWASCPRCGAAVAPPPGPPVATAVAGPPGKAQAADGRPLPYRPGGLRTLGAWAEGLAWAAAAAWVVVAVLGVQQRGAWHDFAHSGSPDRAGLLDVVAAEDAYAGMTGAMLVAAIPFAVLLVVWSYRTYKQSAAPDATLRYTPAVAAGGWFLPIVNFIIMPRVMNDTWRLSGPDATPPRGDRWRSQPGNRLVWPWFLGLLAGLIVLNVARIPDVTSATVADLDRHYDLLVLAPALFAVGVAAQAAFLRATRLRLFQRDTGAVA